MPFGNFIIEKPNNEEVKAKTTFTGYDYMIKFNTLYDDSQNIYPKKLKDFFSDLCSQVGLEAGNLDFINADYSVLGNPFTNNEDCRTVLSAIAQLAGGFAKIGRDNKVYIVSLANRSKILKVKDVHKMTVAELTATPVKMLGTKLINNGEVPPEDKIDGNNYFDDFARNNKWGEVNSVILRLSGTEGENTVLQDNDSIAENGLTEIVIEDNPFLISQRERVKVITPLWNSLKGISYTPFKAKYYGFPYLDSGDMLEIADTEDKVYYTYVFNHTFEYNGSFSGELSTEAMTKTQTAYKNVVGVKTKFKQAERRIDKINGEIEDIVEEQTDFSNKITRHSQDIDSINDDINRIYDFTKTVEGTNELLLEDCLPTNMLKFKLYANTVKGLYPKETLFPSPTLYPKKGGTTITIVVGRTSRVVAPDPILPSKALFPSKKLYPRSNGYYKREYSFYIATPLRSFNDIHDEFVIEVDQEEGICTAKIYRYIQVDYETGATTILDEPIEEVIGETYLELYKGNNYVYIEEFTDWQMEATYIFNNELNEWYAPRVESNTKIRQTADEIELKVSEKADKDEIVSLINLSPEQIKIQSSKLALEGLTTINGGFSIDEKGNASIANNTVVINDKGIQMKDGATLVGGKGLLSNLQFVGNGAHSPDDNLDTTFGSFERLGFEVDSMNGLCVRNYILITADIPNNFTVAKAYITLSHYPIFFKNWGYARKLKLYRRTVSDGMYQKVSLFGDSGGFTEIDGTEIENAFGKDGFNPKKADNENQFFEQIQSIDLTNELKVYDNNSKIEFIVKTDDERPAFVDTGGWADDGTYERCANKSGLVMATLNVFGYLSLE